MWKDKGLMCDLEKKKLISIQTFDKFILAQSSTPNKQKATILSNHLCIIKFTFWNLYR